MRIVLVASAPIVACVVAATVIASGTYCPPLPPPGSVCGVPRQDIDRGKALFQGTSLGKGRGSCASCHDSGASTPLRRASLKGRSADLARLINRCVTHPARTAGVALRPGSTELLMLGTYLQAKFSLPVESMLSLKQGSPPAHDGSGRTATEPVP
jgi:hypothetical protein